VKKLLEANATGRIPDSHFDKMFTEYADEQDTLERQIAEWKKQVADFEYDGTRADKFIELVKSYTQFTELTTQMLNEFIDKVVIHEREDKSRKTPRKIEIYLRFIGSFSAPIDESDSVEELTPEQLEKIERQRLRRNEICRNYRERKKASLATENPAAENPEPDLEELPANPISAA